MSAAADHRAVEVAAKLALARQWLADSGAGALRLRGIDWFAWLTAGGSSAVLLAAETGVAEVLVTA
ncbi:MAG: peptidase M24, partial [Telluria sp.]